MIKLYNSFTKKKEEFKPLIQNQVKIYSCGPTVYDTPHIGNLRAYIVWDTLKRMFRYFNYEVIDVINITDVGHLTSDEDDGEDKMIKAAKKEKKDPFEIARYYEDYYLKQIKRLNVIFPKYFPRATEHIKEQIEMIKHLEENGYTYITSDGVYFDTSKFKDYGKLSGQSLKDKKEGARVVKNLEKKNSTDFALWKFTVGENKNHSMKWESYWGEGFPGWHIECSAMSHKYLGDKFDIHTGGIDHIPVHHENEIAQNICSKDIKIINYWMHNAFLKINNQKMSKSKGNFYTLDILKEKGFSDLSFRETCLRTHYRKTLNFTIESLKAGEANVKKINDFYSKFEQLTVSKIENDNIKNLYNKSIKIFENAIKDDLNIPIALSVLYDFMNEVNKNSQFSKNDIELIIKFMKKTDEIFGLLIKQDKIPNEIIEIAKKRKIARDNKNWSESDKLRDEIVARGYEIRDSNESKEGYILNKI